MAIYHWLLLSIWCATTAAQKAIEKCNSAGEWWKPLKNTHGEDPCQIARLMKQLCSDTAISQPFLTADPSTGQPTDGCLCHSFTFVTYGACIACQETEPPASIQFTHSYTQWSSRCKGNIKPFPSMGTVPNWAIEFGKTYEADPLKTFSVSDLVARTGSDNNIGTKPLSILTPDITSSATDAISPTATLNSQSSSSPESKKANTGAIVGGVIAGVVVVVVAVLLAFLYARKKRTKEVAPSSEFSKYHQGPSMQPPPGSPDAAELQGTIVSRSGARSYTPLRQGSGDESGGDDELPAFTPGRYVGPIYEKPGQYVSDPNVPLRSASQGQLMGQDSRRPT